MFFPLLPSCSLFPCCLHSLFLYLSFILSFFIPSFSCSSLTQLASLPLMCISQGFCSVFCFRVTRLRISAHTWVAPCLKCMDLLTAKIFSCSTGSIPIKYQIGPLFSPLLWLLCSFTAACVPEFLLLSSLYSTLFDCDISFILYILQSLCSRHCFLSYGTAVPNHDKSCDRMQPVLQSKNLRCNRKKTVCCLVQCNKSLSQFLSQFVVL